MVHCNTIVCVYRLPAFLFRFDFQAWKYDIRQIKNTRKNTKNINTGKIEKKETIDDKQ